MQIEIVASDRRRNPARVGLASRGHRGQGLTQGSDSSQGVGTLRGTPREHRRVLAGDETRADLLIRARRERGTTPAQRLGDARALAGTQKERYTQLLAYATISGRQRIYVNSRTP